jgi:hypothetical protein
MSTSIPPIYLLAVGFILFIIIGLFIKKQNSILEGAGENTGYTAYNNKIRPPEELMNIWRNEPYAKSVKNIVFLDFIWMLVFGSSIFYGLKLISNYASEKLKITCSTGMVLIVLMVVFDALQDVAIYQHLTKGKTFDVRGLTKPKFVSLIISLVILIIGIILKWKMIVKYKGF